MRRSGRFGCTRPLPATFACIVHTSVPTADPAPRPHHPLQQMGHATAEAVVRAGLTLVPYSLTGESEAVAVGNVGVSGEPSWDV